MHAEDALPATFPDGLGANLDNLLPSHAEDEYVTAHITLQDLDDSGPQPFFILPVHAEHSLRLMSAVHLHLQKLALNCHC